MYKIIARASVAVTAATVLSLLGIAGVIPAGASAQAPPQARVPSLVVSSAQAVPGAQLWVKRYNGPGVAYSMAVNPAGSKVFVTGLSYGGLATDNDYATIAYSG